MLSTTESLLLVRPDGESSIQEHVLTGTAAEIGFQHGQLLKAPIQAMIRIYARDAFRLDLHPKETFKSPGIRDDQKARAQAKDAFLDLAYSFREKIAMVDEEYCEEIESIAKGADVDPRWIYALNCRTELLPPRARPSASGKSSTSAINSAADEDGECSTVWMKTKEENGHGGILAQNWDWLEDLKQYVCMMRIKRRRKKKTSSNHATPLTSPKEGGPTETESSWFADILMLTEPGIIGKIGINNHGISTALNLITDYSVLRGRCAHTFILLRILTGICLNFFRHICKFILLLSMICLIFTSVWLGVPVHILLRRFLECSSLEEADHVANKYGSDLLFVLQR